MIVNLYFQISDTPNRQIRRVAKKFVLKTTMFHFKTSNKISTKVNFYDDVKNSEKVLVIYEKNSSNV